MTDSITVTTGARLHFGLLVAGPPDCRRYGGIGLMVDQPRFSLTLSRSDQPRIDATPAVQERIAELIRSSTHGCQPVVIEIHEEIPAHAGLGSGTQLALAVGIALSRLHNEPASVEALGRRLGRGTRSIVGTVGFASGGLISHRISPPESSGASNIVRLDFPEAWRFILVTPPSDAGLSGEPERQIFRELPPMSEGQLQLLGDLRRGLMASAMASDFDTFSKLLRVFGQSVGGYFANVQGGTFASPSMADLADMLHSNGIQGVGQSSWGPTLFALCETPSDAASLAEHVRRWHRFEDCLIQVVAAKNTGATIAIH